MATNVLRMPLIEVLQQRPPQDISREGPYQLVCGGGCRAAAYIGDDIQRLLQLFVFGRLCTILLLGSPTMGEY